MSINFNMFGSIILYQIMDNVNGQFIVTVYAHEAVQLNFQIIVIHISLKSLLEF